MAGLANKLSTGMEKKPWICPACRSMVTRWSAPAVVSRSATSRAMIGLRGLSTCTQQNIVTAATVVFREDSTQMAWLLLLLCRLQRPSMKSSIATYNKELALSIE